MDSSVPSLVPVGTITLTLYAPIVISVQFLFAISKPSQSEKS